MSDRAEGEERWTIEVSDCCGGWERAYSDYEAPRRCPWCGKGDIGPVEVVRLSRFEEVQQERDRFDDEAEQQGVLRAEADVRAERAETALEAARREIMDLQSKRGSGA